MLTREKGELLFEHPWEDYDAYVGFLEEFNEQGGFDIIFDPRRLQMRGQKQQ